MNTIPSVGPEPSIAPRTGSGSPQTTPQQRADVAPVVISDSSTARADPGVMLKITPPVGARQGDVAVPQHALPGEVAKTLADLEAERAGEIRALLGSAADADEAVSARLNQAFAALPADVQEAIRQATTPGMAQLLRLASLTASGIREAPARLDTGGQPLAPDAQQAAKALLDAIHASPPFQLANLLRLIAQGRMGTEENIAGAGTPRGAQADSSVTLGLAPAPTGRMVASGADGYGASAVPGATETLPVAGGAADQGASGGPGEGLSSRSALPNADPRLASPAVEGSTRGQPGPSAGTLSPGQGGLAATLSEPLPAPQGAQQYGAGSAIQGFLPSQAFSAGGGISDPGMGQSSGTVLSGGNVPMTAGVLLAAPALMAVDQAEAGLRDALRLLMDGRMIWQGQFTEGVPMALERADAWRANRRETGGMEKGTSLRLRLQLPHLGELEVRALGFGGQVAVRVHAQAESTGDMVNALPRLQERLRERGLAGAQVVVESL